jgi:archaemetzincin
LSTKQHPSVEDIHLDLFPMGSMDMTAVSIIAANLQTILGLNTRILPVQPEPEYAFLARREQYDAGKILHALTTVSDSSPFRLAVVSVDIFTPILTFVFGESQLGGKAAVISLFRAKSKNREKSYNRAAKIAIHEVGHLLGLVHCRTPDCLMGFSNNLEKLDSQPMRFCQACEFEAGRRLRHLFGKPGERDRDESG